MGHVIAVVNNKGGVGKTTIAFNLAHALGTRGQTVLLADLDNQCNLTSNFFPMPPESTLYEILDGDGIPPNKCIYPTPYDKVWVLPNTEDTGPLEPVLLERPDKGYPLLADRLRPHVVERFDVTFLDCPPNLGLFSLQAMAAADFVLCPVAGGSRYATAGLDKTIRTIQFVQAEINPNLRFLRLALNQVDKRESVDKAFLAGIYEDYAGLVFDTIIPRCTAVKRSEATRESVLRGSPGSTAAASFRKLSLELTGILKG